MKICFFNTTQAWGGGEKWHLEMAKNLSDSCTNCFIVAHPKSDLYKKAVKEHIRLFMFKLNNISFLNPIKMFNLLKFFRQHNPDIVILNLPRDLKAAGIAAKWAGIKKIIYRRGSAIPVKNSFLNRFLFKKVVTGVIANSLETKHTILKNNQGMISENKIKVLYNGIDTDRLNNAGIFFIPKRTKGLVIGNLGRMVDQKGQLDLIPLAKQLNAKNIEFTMLIGGSGPLENTLKTRVKEAGLTDCFEFPGFIDDVKGFMTCIDVFVLPSRWEGFGYVLVEAMALGKPVLAYRVSSNPEIIKNNVTGWLVPPGNIQEMAEKIIELQNNPMLLKKMRTACIDHVQENFTLEKSVRATGKYLTSL